LIYFVELTLNKETDPLQSCKIQIQRHFTAEECFHEHISRMRSVIKSAEGFLCETGAHEILPWPSARQAARFLSAFATAGYSGKAAEIARGSGAGRTAFGKFLSQRKWDEPKLASTARLRAVEAPLGEAFEAVRPAIVSINFTVCIESRPRKGARRPTQGAGLHCSHLEGKKVYGRQALATVIEAGSGTAHCLAIEQCGMGRNQIEMARGFAAGLPRPKARGYALFDSWHACQAVVEVFWGAGRHSKARLRQTGQLCQMGQGFS
jgi:hypothetical protein